MPAEKPFKLPDDPALLQELTALYEQIMWLARQSNVTPSMARAWYTHVVAERVKRRIRHFTGSVSRAASADPSATLRLEHYMRIQTKLTALVTAHLKLQTPSSKEFIQALLEHERVHIVTLKENYEAMKAGGDYSKAGIELVAWSDISIEHRRTLWTKMLRGKVMNAADYAVVPTPAGLDRVDSRASIEAPKSGGNLTNAPDTGALAHLLGAPPCQ